MDNGPIEINKLDEFTTAYLVCALWCTMDDDSNPLDVTYYLDDFAPETLAAAITDCGAFQEAHAADIDGNYRRAGNDFWLTRNGHGSDFADSDCWSRETAERLNKAAREFGSVDLYVGDDKRLYFA